MSEPLSRRSFLRDTAALGVAASVLRSTGASGAETVAALPKIRLGTLEVSRLILGSNPFFGYAHQPGELGQQMVEYYTDERIMAVLDEAAALGVTAVAAPPSRDWIALFRRYLDRGGKLRTWIAQPHGSPKKMKDEITAAVKGGAKALFIQGHRVEEQFEAGKLEVVRGWVEHAKGLGVPAGMASHRPDVHLAAEKAGFPTDFYFQCFYRPETYTAEDRDRAVATIRQITTKPVVAYKILAAGRLPPEEAFKFAFEHIAAKDGVCVGVYPKGKPDMIAQDVGLARKWSKG